MSKSILVIDTPENCDKCRLMHSYFDNGYGWIKECIGSGENDCIVFNKKIEDYCPLKPLPQRKNSLTVVDGDGVRFVEPTEYEEGFNACINEILGEIDGSKTFE